MGPDRRHTHGGWEAAVATAIQILTEQFAESSGALLRLLGSVSEDEFLWRPVAGAWTDGVAGGSRRFGELDLLGVRVRTREVERPDPRR
jgi:hypothetical protein